MFKRILIGILAVVLCMFPLCGCSLFTYDNERDLQQEIARVYSYKINNFITTTEVNEATGVEEEKTVPCTYVTKAKTIYKRDLVEYVRANASSLSSSFGSDLEGLYKYAANMLVSVELVTNEVDALIDCGKVKWDIEDFNIIKQNIYSVIDNTLNSIKNEILTERGYEQTITDNDSASSADTTFPVKPEATDNVEDDDDMNKTPVEPWEPSFSRYPGVAGNDDERSLGRATMNRFLTLIKGRVKDDFRMSSAERKAINNEIKAIDKLIKEDGIEKVYPVIGTYPLYTVNDQDEKVETTFGHIMYYISGKSLERSQKIAALQKYLTDATTVTDAEVMSSFTAKLNEQKARYDADISAFDSAMSGSGNTVLYYPNSNYFYVKHILLPFSDEQKDALTAYSNRPEIAGLEDNEKDERVKEYRSLLAQSIVCYPHVNGENDLSRQMSVDQVVSHIRSVMLPLEADVAAADVAFDDMIYLYNTDPGAFNNNKGYVVKYRLNEGERETYMQEFADASRYMYDNLDVGQVYYEKVITDYGVHIMYFASKTSRGAVDINSYTTPGRLETYYDIIAAPIHTARENAAYTTWENNVLSYNYKTNSKIYTENFSNLWEDD